MSIIQAIILGIVQGFSEFLPISSSGHLILFQTMFGLKENMILFDILLHVGTLFSIFIFYFEDILKLIKKPFQKINFLLAVGTIPAIIVTLFLKDKIEILFKGGIFLVLTFFITAILLIIADYTKNTFKKDKEISYKDAFIVGIFQAIAILPGISRSGSTITISILRKFNKKTAAKFSFLLSIPAILGAAVFQAKDLIICSKANENLKFIPLILGFFASVISGYISIKFMVNLITKCKLKYFSYYLFFISFIILLDNLFFHKFF